MPVGALWPVSDQEYLTWETARFRQRWRLDAVRDGVELRSGPDTSWEAVSAQKQGERATAQLDQAIRVWTSWGERLSAAPEMSGQYDLFSDQGGEAA